MNVILEYYMDKYVTGVRIMDLLSLNKSWEFLLSSEGILRIPTINQWKIIGVDEI